jgi:2-polyprenyl-3-methyl-5-hydroxy-6-metoxy-1,4-benzoquinol methylase
MLKKLFKKKIRSVVEHDFSLHSGERQTGTSLAQIRHDHRARYQLVAGFIKEQLGQDNSLFGLDIYCGTGYGTYMLSESLDCPVIGIDASKDAINVAEQHYSNKKTLYVHKLFPFNLPEVTFDFIACIESLEHTAEPEQFINLMARSLKKKSCLVLSTPNETMFSLSRNPNKFHIRHYTMMDMLGIFEQVPGLKVVKWFGQNIYEMNNGKIFRELPQNEMNLTENKEGQILLYILESC